MRILASAGVQIPPTSLVSDLSADDRAWCPFDAVVKPIDGSASQGIAYVARGGRIDADKPSRTILQQRIRGAEYTVNVFVDQRAHVRCIVPHRRVRIRAGEVEKGYTERNEVLAQQGREIAAAIPGLTGPFCFQAIVTESGESHVFEVNARFGGGYPLCHEAGGKFTKWILEEATGRPCTASDDWMDRLNMIRYDEAIFWKGDPA